MEINTSQIADKPRCTQPDSITAAQKILPYADIIRLPHHISRTHSQMSLRGRAAQFAPFAALTGLEEDFAETAHLVQESYDSG